MSRFRESFLDELEKNAERKRSSKKKRVAGTGTGAVAGAAMGAPAGLLGALAMMAMKPKRFRIATPKGIRGTHKFLYGGGLDRELRRVSHEGRKHIIKGLAAGVGGGGAIGGLAGHEISKQAAVIASRITPGSSSVRGYSYDKKSGNLLITFKNGGTYRYKGVSPAAARAMGRNKSVGKTVHKRIKMGGYQYEKVGAKKKQKNYKCKFCKDPATKGVIWAEGRGIVPCCDKHLAKGKVSIDDPKDIDLIRDLTKQSSAADAQRAFYASTKISPYYAKKQRDKRNAAEAKRMAKKAEEEPIMLQVEPHEPLPEETSISSRVFQNLTEQAKTLPEEAVASQSDLVMDKMSSVRRQIAKLAGACKKQLTWHGLTMKFEYLDKEDRSGVNREGKKWSRTMRGCYGYMPGTYGKGADGEAIDVYFSPKASDEAPGNVYKIRQLRKDDGKFDEDKFMVGYASSEDAKKAFLSNMPKWAFGDITEMSMDSFKTLVGQDQKKRKAS